MKKLALDLALIVIVLGSYTLQLKAQAPATTQAATVPAGKVTALTPELKIEILTLQRNYTAAVAEEQQRRQAEQQREADAEKAINDSVTKLTAAIQKARTELKLSDSVQFDAVNLQFVDAPKK